jgi:thymidylate kinase
VISQLLDCLIESLTSEGVVFCHWKSNFHLKDALVEGGDLDLLVDRKDAQQFERIVADLGFKRAADPLQEPSSSVLHFYGLEDATGILLHLHVYYRIITGESLLKNYSFPLEELFLQHPRLVDGIPLPQASAELMLFVIRAMAKHASLLEYLLLQRNNRAGYTALREELEALLGDDSAARCSELLANWLPSVDSALFYECIDALRKDAPFARRLWLAMRLRGQLRAYNRFSSMSAIFQRVMLFLTRTTRQLRGAGKSKQIASGGALIAFVGPEATGKSTLVQETANWLGKAFDISTAHLGKPPSTWLTCLPNLALPLLRKAAPQYRMSRVENTPAGAEAGNVSLLFALRSVLLAWDRRALAIQVRRKAAQGGIVICDRYPSVMVGAMDSARLKVPADTSGRGMLLGWLARLENRIYRQIPPPDVVIRLTVPVGVAIERNKERQKKGKEADAYVLRRHISGVVPVFPTTKTIEVDSNQPRSQTISTVRQIVWDLL